MGPRRWLVVVWILNTKKKQFEHVFILKHTIKWSNRASLNIWNLNVWGLLYWDERSSVLPSEQPGYQTVVGVLGVKPQPPGGEAGIQLETIWDI